MITYEEREVPTYGMHATRLETVKVLYCDRCGCEAEEIWDVDGEDMCEDCLHKAFTKTTLED